MESVLPDDIFEYLPSPYAIITFDTGIPVVSKINKALVDFVKKGPEEIEGQPVSFLSRLYSDKAGVDLHDFMTVSLQSVFTTGRQDTSAYFEDFETKGLAGRTYWSLQNTPVHRHNGSSYVIHCIQMEIYPYERDEKEIEKELRNYRFALDSANVIAITDARGIIQYVNDAFCHISGYTRQELIGQTHSIINSGYHDKAFFRNLWGTITSGQVWKGEVRNKTKQGEYYWMDTTIIPFLNDHGRPFRYVSIRREISQQKQTEALLKSSEEKYKVLFNCSPIPMWIYDMETYCFIDVNQAAERHYGYSREEFMALTIKDIRPEEDIPVVVASVEHLKKFERRYSRNNYRHLKKDGTEIRVRIESNVINLGGRKACIVLAIDITEDEQLRREIIATNNTLSTAQAMANLGHWIYNLKTRQIYWSEEMYRIFDTDRETFVPAMENLQGFFEQEARARFTMTPDQLFEAGDMGSLENTIVTAQQNKKWLHHTRRLIRDEQQRPVQIEGICMDITRSRMDEAALQRKNSLLDAINKFTTILLGRGRPIDIVNRAFGVIAEIVNVDRVYFYQSHSYENGTYLVNQRIEWSKGGKLPVIDNPDMQQLSLCLADLAAGLFPGGHFAAIVKDLPDSSLKIFLVNQKALSIAALPIFINDKFYGFVSFEHLLQEHKWQEDEFAFLEAVTGHLATAIERYNAAKALKSSREQFRSVIYNLPGITYRCKNDQYWTMVFMSDEVERMTGYPAAGFIDNLEQSFASVIHPDDRGQTYHITEYLKKHKPFEVEYRVVRSDGSTIWVKDIGRGVYNNNGQLMWIDGVILDITDRVRQEQRLVDSNERFRLVMKASREAIIDWDIENDVTVWGDGFSEVFNYDLKVYDNHLWSRNIHPDDKARVLKALEETIADPSRNTLDLHFRFLKAGGETAYVYHRGIFIRNQDGTAVRAIGSMADETDFTMHTRKIEQQNVVLREIAWTQSHIVRAPFARLVGLLRLLKEQLPAETDVSGILAYMDESAMELDRIITDIIIKSEQIINKTSNGTTI